jgi:tetratricopeptide (TPR) repeat protein
MGGGGGGGSGGGSGGGGGGTGGATRSLENIPPVCAKGQAYDPAKRRCVKAKKGALNDDALTDYAFALAKAKRFDEALAMLDMLNDSQTAKALNYRGYATRKLGRTDEGISYYLKSVARDPQYAQVREYLGEAYVVKGKPDLAKEQLQAIEKICGRSCEEYEDLDKAIKTGGES